MVGVQGRTRLITCIFIGLVFTNSRVGGNTYRMGGGESVDWVQLSSLFHATWYNSVAMLNEIIMMLVKVQVVCSRLASIPGPLFFEALGPGRVQG